MKDSPFALLITYLVGFTLALLDYTKGKLTNQNMISTIVQTITVGYVTTIACIIAVVIENF